MGGVGVPSPTIPSFTDGTVVHQADLNALASNLTNLYAYNQGGFFTQRPAVIATQTSAQTLVNGFQNYLVTFNSATVNTDNMWVSSQNTQITIQVAGIYWIFSQIRWPATASPSLTEGVSSSILANGTAYANAISTQLLPPVNVGAGPTSQNGVIVNLAAGSTIYLNAWQAITSNLVLQLDAGASYLGAIFLTPSM